MIAERGHKVEREQAVRCAGHAAGRAVEAQQVKGANEKIIEDIIAVKKEKERAAAKGREMKEQKPKDPSRPRSRHFSPPLHFAFVCAILCL